MPSHTPRQKRFMRKAASDPKFAAENKIPVSVAREFVVADKKRGPAPKPGRKIRQP